MLKGLDLHLPKHITVRTPPLEITEWWTSGLPFDAIEEVLRIGTTESVHRVLTSPNRLGGPQTMNPSSTRRDRLDTIDRNHDYFIEGSEMHERDRSVDTGTVVDTTSELGTSKNLDLTALRSVLPQSMAEENLPFPSVDLPNAREFATPHYRQILFSLANNFAGLGGADMKKVIRFLQEETHQGLFELILNNSSYSARAITQSIFTGAIELGDARLIDLLLNKKSTGIDVDEFWCHIEGNRYTPIERGSLLRHKEVVKVLLEHDADVNRTDPERRSRPSGALECAVGITGKDYTRVDPQIFHMLLNAGGNLSRLTLATLIQRRDRDFAGLFMSANAHKNVAEWNKWGLYRDAVLFLDDRTAVAIVRIMLDIRADLNFYVKRDYDQDIYHPCRVIDAAARRGNMEMIEILLGSEALVTDETLLFAVVSGNHILVRFILDRGANVNSHHCINILTTSGEILTTPLAEAIRLQDTEIIGLLQQYGPIRLDDRTQFSAAIIAASEVGNVPFIKDLIQRGNQARANDLGYALAVAIKEGQNEAATMLIDAGANMNECAAAEEGIGPPLVEALARRDAGLVHLLLEAGALPNGHYQYPQKSLQFAVEWGDRSIVETLIHAGAVMNYDMVDEEKAPLTLAVKSQDQAMVKLLLDAGADINSYVMSSLDVVRSSALEAALGNKDISMACYLLERGADDIDTQALGKAMIESPRFFNLLLEKHKIRYPVMRAKFGCNALIRAIELEDEHAIRRMLDDRLDANSLIGRDYGKCSPFGYAIANSTIEVIEMFLQKGSNPNSIVTEPLYNYDEVDASYRLTGFLAAIDTGSVSKVELLYKYGADVNFPARTRVKHTPLQKAAAIGNTDIVELLINFGAEVNAAGAQRAGGTALQFAAIGGYIPVACSLLKYHADVNAPASKVNGRMALEGAAEHGRLDMLKLLLNAGAGNEGKDQGQFERAKALAKDQGYSHITDLLDTYLQPKEQENEPVMLADGIHDGLGMWDSNFGIDGFDLGPMDGWMLGGNFSSTFDSGQMYLGGDMDLF